MARNLEPITGLVEQVNQKGTGVRVGAEWLNASQYHPVALPELGQRATFTVERTDRGVARSIRCLSGHGAALAAGLPWSCATFAG